MRLSHLAVGIVLVVMLAPAPAALAQRGEGKTGKARGEAGEREGKDDEEDDDAVRPGAAGMGGGALAGVLHSSYFNTEEHTAAAPTHLPPTKKRR